MAYSKIKTSVSDGVAVVTLCDPSTLNAAGLDLMAELDDAMAGFAAPESGVRCVVITGEGRGFCSGANLTGRADAPAAQDQMQAQARDSGSALETVYNPFVTRMRDYPIPIVTAVNGAAAGIGCSIALMGDLIVAGESGYFLQAFRRIGLVPDGGATYLLSRLVGKARTMELTLLGEKLPAATALQWGLINRCVPDAELMDTAMELAQALATGPRALGYIRKLVWDGLDAEWAEQLHAERVVQREAGLTEDSREGVVAFLQKRPAQFQGR
ncbi:MAG: enoyl-CoA hydratase/isomerase [Phenylobacterium sp.]|uniref:enoyl-CoA hydratase/isomerase n=1 Tax=Phenylobacterium sp. TaxID=1871053 RepID=UPI002733F2D6|nr:enoyl-CoA hydratase/isomerase [Phenylobacterium sp.]MDP1643546.1 enoyl-CoA hydratase/isomerase [Phenylobacterium sp.]MDP3116811.1 enoyl-CoA hydratase/isomerase [Phenylobacterium sp.]MDP3385247.1 enoyl-CoA hydratase/isomerase [Phenylobacterium sp.]